jgi:threonine dehydrogenase-like Zn-dependent dehydrogenase
MDKEIRFSWLAPMVWPTAIRAIAEGLVKTESLITGSVPLAKTGEAIRALKDREGDPLKVQVTP